MPNLTDADKVLRNDTGKDIVTKLDGILNAIEGTKQSLENLSDVNVSNPSDNQAILYNAQSSKWKNTSLGGAAFKNVDSSVTSGSSNPVSSDAVNTGLADKADKSTTYTKTEVNDIASAKADADSVYTKSETYTKSEVDTLISNLPEPMIFKGTLGVNGTITELPTASASNEGYTYKVITDGTYAGQSAKSGDVFVSNGSAWVLIPSGDEDNDTWRAIKVNGTEKLGNAISSGSVDFVDTSDIKVTFDTTGNKIKLTLVNAIPTKTSDLTNDSDFATTSDIPTNTSDLTNDSGFITSNDVPTKTSDLQNDSNFASIDDDTTASNKAWSSQKITDELIALLPVDSASGSIASFSTSLALPLVSLKASIVATESGSGTKSPTNPYTIGGFSNAVITKSGVNLWNEDWEVGEYNVANGNKTGSAGVRSKNKIRVCGGSSITFVVTSGTSSNNIGFCWYDSNGAFISGSVTPANSTKTAPANAVYVTFFCPNSWYGSTYKDDICIVIGSTATAYEPYTATQTTLALGQTVYGGEIILTRKASGGYSVKLRVTHKEYNLGSLNWSLSSVGASKWYTLLAQNELKSGGNNLCGIYTSGNNSEWTNNNNIINSNVNATGSFIRLSDTRFESKTPAEVKTLLSGVYAWCELATPIEIDLTDASDIVALVGVNNVWSDTGDMEVRFKVGIQEYIDSKVGNNRSINLMRSVEPTEEPDVREER